uniref:Variant surface glycoprotein n=2 Tax=Trypanosoma brucei TaxID=5691 RepID=B3GVP4_TRYBB|nr:variant surface glycoprotein MITat 1.8 [Trypanosoma brucei]CAQ57426.1 variant surface glycoprotein [Trypanosoma brucei brucei]
MRTASTTLILLFLALGFFAGTSHCHKAALPIAGLTKVCTFNGELKKAAARATNLISSYVSKLIQLQTLTDDIKLLVTEGLLNATDEIALIQAAGRKGTEDMINTLHNDMPKAIYAAATCSLFAGRVDDFVGVFAGAKGSANYCVKDGDGAYNHAQENKLQGCLEGDGSFQGISEKEQNEPPRLGTSYKALQADTVGRTATGSTCALTQHGTNGGESYAENGQNPNVVWGNGLFKVANGGAAAAVTDWPIHAQQTITDSKFAACQTKMQEAENTLFQSSNLQTKLLELTNKLPKISGKLQIPKSFFDANNPAAGYDVDEAQLQHLQAALASIRETTEYKTKRKTKLLTSSKSLISAASKKCSEPPAAETVKKSNTNKKADKECDSKGKSECNDPCVWKGTNNEGKCVEKEEAKPEEKKEEKCKDKTKEGDCTGNCKWEGETCKDSSILVTKKFALSVVSAAFVALLF